MYCFRTFLASLPYGWSFSGASMPYRRTRTPSPLIMLSPSWTVCAVAASEVTDKRTATILIALLASPPNEAFRFAIRGDKLLVPEGASVLGDGTANWDAIAFCREESPKELTLNYFQAELFNGKSVISGKETGWDSLSHFSFDDVPWSD